MQLTDIFPTIPPVKRLVVLNSDEGNQDTDYWIWLRAFQGLVNRREPHFYLVRHREQDVAPGTVHPHEEHWLRYYGSRFDIPSEQIAGTDDMLERYKGVVDGYILYDMDVLQTMNLAVTRCGLEGLLPIAPEQEAWMARHGIPKRDDLRGKYADDWVAAEWAMDNLWPQCYKKIYANFCIHRPHYSSMSHQLSDFVTMHKIMALDLPTSRQRRKVLYLYRRMLESADPPGVQMGWHCTFDQEKEYVAEAAQRGFFSLCSTSSPNMTIHGGVGDPNKAFTQPLPKKEDCVAEKGKIYIALYNSDGDATWAQSNLQAGNWEAPQRGRFKFGWGFLPLALRLTPAQMQYFHETKTENDCFWGPSSGAGYTYSGLWPDGLREMYLKETRQLLDQSGQNGCNMVNWFLQDWWREVENDETIRNEQEALKSGPGLVCGLGGSPYAQSYLDGPIPKLHSAHIANAGSDNVGDIMKFAAECPSRPLFMFLFAQIRHGVWEHISSEIDRLNDDPNIEVLSMDEFFLTLQDAIGRGLLGDKLYEITDELAETWLKQPGRHRLPVAEKLTEELSDVTSAEPDERRRRLAYNGWTQLVSVEIENVARDKDGFRTRFEPRTPFTEDEEADALFYTAFTVAWTVVRAAIQSQGIYANHRTQCLNDFRRTCGDMVDVTPFESLFDAWERWEQGAPSVEQTTEWIHGVTLAARQLRDALGPNESEEEFTGWPPRSI